MIDPKSLFEKGYGKKESAEFPEQWQKEFDLALDFWMAGYEYAIAVKELEKDVRALSDLQRGVG